MMLMLILPRVALSPATRRRRVDQGTRQIHLSVLLFPLVLNGTVRLPLNSSTCDPPPPPPLPPSLRLAPAEPALSHPQFGAPRSGLGGAIAAGVIRHRKPTPPQSSPQQLLQEEKTEQGSDPAGGAAASGGDGAAGGGGGGGGGSGDVDDVATVLEAVAVVALDRLAESLETVSDCLRAAGELAEG